MPCNDVTESITVVVDRRDRLHGYSFTKRTCGRGVGAHDLLSDYLAGRTVDEIASISAKQCLEELSVQATIEEFLALKHLVAVQAALDVLTGRGALVQDDFCRPAEVAFDEGLTSLRAQIRVDLIPERISACGAACRSCGTPRRRRRKRTEAAAAH